MFRAQLASFSSGLGQEVHHLNHSMIVGKVLDFLFTKNKPHPTGRTFHSSVESLVIPCRRLGVSWSKIWMRQCKQNVWWHTRGFGARSPWSNLSWHTLHLRNWSSKNDPSTISLTSVLLEAPAERAEAPPAPVLFELDIVANRLVPQQNDDVVCNT